MNEDTYISRYESAPWGGGGVPPAEFKKRHNLWKIGHSSCYLHVLVTTFHHLILFWLVLSVNNSIEPNLSTQRLLYVNTMYTY